MANVGFKLGTQAKVDELLKTPGTAVVEGSFYLTNDTHRLYIGQKSNSSDANAQLFAVNEGVITVATINDLPNVSADNGSVYAGRFYYVTAGNILCVHNGKAWVQINSNTDTTITEHSVSVSAENNVGTITDNIKLSNNHDKNASYTITGANGITITGTGTALTLSGDTYTLSGTVASNEATLKLDSKNTANDSSVVIAGGSNVSISQDASTKKITVAAVDTTVKTVTGASVEGGNGFNISVTDTKNATKSGTIDPQIKVGKTKTSTVHFANGIATLDVYSTSDIDDKMKALNAMTYKGTLGTDGTISVLPTTNVSVGDSYLISTRQTINSSTVYPGSLIIARGTEDPATGYITGDITWDIVQSTQDSDTTYKFENIEGGIQMRSSTNHLVGSMKIAGDGNYITASSQSAANKDQDQVITLSHKTITQADTTEAALTQNKVGNTDITTVVGVSRDTAGHVTGIKTKKITLVDTNSAVSAVSYATSVASNVGTVTGSVTTKNAANADTTKTGTFTLASDTMAVTANGVNGLKVDLTWGSF